MGPRPNVVIIDADTEFAQDLRGELEARNIDSADTGEGKTGLDLARQNLPQAVILCVELPRMSGYTICSTLKKDPELKHIPVIITSSGATAETFDQHRRLKKSHAQAYVHKPASAASVAEVLVTVLGPDVMSESAVKVEEESELPIESHEQGVSNLTEEEGSSQDDMEEPVEETGGISSQDVESVSELEPEVVEEIAKVSAAPPALPPADEESNGNQEEEDLSSEDEELDAALADVLGEEESVDLPQSKTETEIEEPVDESELVDSDLAARSSLPEHDVFFSDIPQEEESAIAKDSTEKESIASENATVEPREIEEEDQSLKAHITYLESRVEQLENEKSELHIAHGHAESARTSRISVSTRETLALKKERNAIKKKLLEFQATIAERDAELLTWNDREMELESQIVEISDENDKLLTEKAELEDTLAGKRSDFVATEARLQQLREEHEALVDHHQHTKNQLSTLEEEAEELRSQLPGELEQEKLSELEDQLLAANTSIESLKDSVLAKEQELAQESESRKSQEAQQQQLATELETAQSVIKEAEKEHGELRIALDEAELNKEIVENELDEVNASLGAMADMRLKALKALQIAQALLHESANLIGEPEYPEEFSGDLQSQDLSQDLIRELSSDIGPKDEADVEDPTS